MKIFNSQFFLYAFFCTIGLCVLLIIGINIIVDPFYRFNLVTIKGINQQRHQSSANVRLTKAGGVCRINPDVIILGTSRAEIGFDPHHPVFGNKRVYNLAMAGTGIKEMSDYLLHSIYAAPHLRQAIVTLDFLMFNAYREEVLFKTEVVDFDAGRLLRQPNETCVNNFLYEINTLIGIKGLAYVLQTLREQRDENEKKNLNNIAQANWWMAEYSSDGFRGYSYKVLDDLIKNYNTRIFFEGDYSQEDYYMKKIWRGGLSHRYCFVKTGQPNTLDIFREIVTMSRKAGIDVKFIINPIHAQMLITIQEAGLWPQYENWKRELVKILTEDGKKNPHRPYVLWDFSGFNSIATEKIPLANEKNLSVWFWQTSHFKKETGDLILNKVLGNKDKQSAIPTDFGILLNQENIEYWLNKTLLLSQQYIASHKEEVKNLRTHLSLQYNHDWIGTNCGDDIEAIREGSLALKNGDIKKADALFDRAQDIHNLNRKIADKLGVPDRELGFERILADARAGKMIEEPLESWQAYQERGNKKVKENNLLGAIDDYNAALKDSPPNPALYFLLGTTKIRLGDYTGAAHDFREALKIDPNDKNLKLLLAKATSRL